MLTINMETTVSFTIQQTISGCRKFGSTVHMMRSLCPCAQHRRVECHSVEQCWWKVCLLSICLFLSLCRGFSVLLFSFFLFFCVWNFTLFSWLVTVSLPFCSPWQNTWIRVTATQFFVCFPAVIIGHGLHRNSWKF